jgi:uncharacterized C2H2 Zn-finger protein
MSLLAPTTVNNELDKSTDVINIGGKSRYRCPKLLCTKTFSRRADAKRHHKETHLKQPRKKTQSSVKYKQKEAP